MFEAEAVIKKGGMLPKIVSVILFLLAGMSITMTSHGVSKSGMCVQNKISLPNQFRVLVRWSSKSVNIVRKGEKWKRCKLHYSYTFIGHIGVRK